ncbi:MAG: TlpA family protein disulfide reductase, partial [Deltaproteobacteria bacterium]|nr:TlpA family protein disulfide reductase [Deltaproteobacteria bacterium]
MKLLGALLILAALAVLGLFLWPLLQPEAVQGPQQVEAGYARSQLVVTGDQAAAGMRPDEAGRGEAVLTAPRPAPAGPTSLVPGVPGSPGPAQAAVEMVQRTAEPAAPAGPLCDRFFDTHSTRKLPLPPHRRVRSAKAGGAAGSSAWTWISIWAAWCKPCKEEMPVLAQWAQQLRRNGRDLRLLFLSVDDDERELHRYVDGPGRGIDGDFIWVDSGSARSAFYSALGVKDPPTLPVQIVLDAEGRLRC